MLGIGSDSRMISRDYRARAKISLKNRWLNTSASVFIYNMIMGIVSSISAVVVWLMLFGMIGKTFEEIIEETVKEYPYMKADFDKLMKDDTYKQAIKFLDHLVGSISDLLPTLALIAIISFILYLVLNSMLSFGLYKTYLDAARMKEVQIGNLFSNIKFWSKMIGVLVYRYIIIALGYILIVPGIIFTMKYLLAPFILIDNPDISVSECIRKSSELVNGRKWNLFCLCVSYIGWLLVACWIGSVIGGFIPFGSVIILAVFWVYFYVGIAHFYLNISGQDNTINREELYNNEN